MHSYKLIREKDPKKAEWSLEWDESVFKVKAPDGHLALETEHAHRLLEIYQLYAKNQLSLETPEGALTFKQEKNAAKELRRYLETGLETDSEYREQLTKDSSRIISRGIRMFFIGGIPFALYCWWAAIAPDPVPGGWLRTMLVMTGWLIHLLLIVLLGLALAGPYVIYFGLRQRRLLRRIHEESRNRL